MTLMVNDTRCIGTEGAFISSEVIEMTLVVNDTRCVGMEGAFISSEVTKMTLMVNDTRHIGTEWPKKSLVVSSTLRSSFAGESTGVTSTERSAYPRTGSSTWIGASSEIVDREGVFTVSKMDALCIHFGSHYTEAHSKRH